MSLVCAQRHVSYGVRRLGLFHVFIASSNLHPVLELDFLRPSKTRLRASEPRFSSLTTSRARTRDETGSYRGEVGPGRDFLEQVLKSKKTTSKLATGDGHDRVTETTLEARDEVPDIQYSDVDLVNLQPPQVSMLTTRERKQSSRPRLWTPYSERGKEDLMSMVSDLKKLTKKATMETEDIPFEPSKRLSELLPESPVLRRAAAKRIHKFRPETDDPLENNPWARMLAGPIRFDQGTGLRLPRDLLVPWGLVRNPNDRQVYLMPEELTDFEHLRNPPFKVQSKTASPDQPNIEKVELNADFDPAGLPDETGDSIGEGSVVDTTAKSEKGPGSISKLWLLPLSSLIRQLTILFTSEPDKHGIRRAKVNQVGRLISERWTTALAAAATRAGASRRLGARRRHDVVTVPRVAELEAEAEHKMEADAKERPAEDIVYRSKILWQPDIETRILSILQQRVLASLEGLARQNSSRRARHEKRVLAIPIMETAFAGNTAGEVIAKRFSPPQVAESDGEDPQESDKSNDFLNRIPGSIFLHIDTSTSLTPRALRFDPEADPMLSNMGADFSPTLQPLPSHPLVPFTITVLDRIRLPLFSLHDLLGTEGVRQFRVISKQVRLGASRQSRKDAQGATQIHVNANDADGFGPATVGDTPSESEFESDYVLLIKAKAPGASALIEEIWRLWRYIGGNKTMDPRFRYNGDIFDYRKDPAVQELFKQGQT